MPHTLANQMCGRLGRERCADQPECHWGHGVCLSRPPHVPKQPALIARALEAAGHPDSPYAHPRYSL